MRLGNKQLGVIVIAVGIIVLFVTIQGYFRSNMAEVDKINTEIGTLESEVDRLEGLKAKSAEMDKDIQSSQNTINQSLKDFAIEFRSEDGILLMDEFENSTTFNVAISDASFTEAGASIDEAAARTSSTGEFSVASDIGSGYVMRTGVVTFQYTADSYDAYKGENSDSRRGDGHEDSGFRPSCRQFSQREICRLASITDG